MRVIFLDIDGVLNGNSFYERRRLRRKRAEYETDFYNRAGFDGRFEIDDRAVALLNELVKRTDAYLVLSSTWRLGSRGPDKLDGLDFTKRALALNGFEHNDRFLGKTPRLYRTPEGVEQVRGHEIQNWIDMWHVVAFNGDVPVGAKEYITRHPRTLPRRPREHRNVESFVILDDDSDMAHLLPRLCWTPCWTGLTPWKCEEAERLLLDPEAVGSYFARRERERPPKVKRPRLKLRKKTGTRRE